MRAGKWGKHGEVGIRRGSMEKEEKGEKVREMEL